MAKQLPITSIVKSIVESTGRNADNYFMDSTASSKRYKFWQIAPNDQEIATINLSFKRAGINAQAKRIKKGKWVNMECLGIFVGHEHANLSKEQLDILQIM